MIEKLGVVLKRATAKSIKGLRSFGILFSAGLDSALIAKICEGLGNPGVLYTVGVEGSHDLENITTVKNFFTAEIKVKTIRNEELEKYLQKVIQITGFYNPIQVGISIPLFVACEFARNDGMKVVLAGQGADELFGGYQRYLKFSAGDLERELTKDIEELQPILERREYAIAKYNRIDLRLPYLDPGVIKIASEIPVDLKIKNGERKYILREVAKRIELPDEIVNKEKKAMQYSSGIDKAVRRLAKAKNKSLKEYLNDVYFETR